MQRAPRNRAVVYVGLAIVGLLIFVFMDWRTALVYALVVLGAVSSEWLLGRWDWFEKRRRQRASERRRRAIERATREADARTGLRHGGASASGFLMGGMGRSGGDFGGGGDGGGD